MATTYVNIFKWKSHLCKILRFLQSKNVSAVNSLAFQQTVNVNDLFEYESDIRQLGFLKLTNYGKRPTVMSFGVPIDCVKNGIHLRKSLLFVPVSV